MSNRKQAREGTTSVKEKICYAIGDFGGNLAWGLIGSYLTLYYTDSVGLAGAFLGTMMLLCRVFDGASDILMGVVIEKTNTRWGKARPWVIFMGIPFVISLLLIFNVPGQFTKMAKNIYVCVTYFFLTVICYTGVNLSYHAMLSRISTNQNDRTVTSTVRSIFSTGAYMVLSVAVPMILGKFGGEDSQEAWRIIAIIFSVATLICFLICFFGVKEKVVKEEVTEKTPIKAALKVLVKNKYFYIGAGLFLLFYVSTGLSQGAIYYVKNVLGNFNLITGFSLASTFSIIVAVPFAPKLLDKIGRRRGMILGLVLSIIGSFIWLIDTRNVTIAFIAVIIRSIGTAPLSVAIFTLAGDIIDYCDWQHGMRTEGLVTSVNSFGIKVGTGIGSAIVGWMLTWGHYDGALTVQPESAISSIVGFTVVLPIFVFILCIALLAFWDIDKYRPEIDKYLSEKAKSSEQS